MPAFSRLQKICVRAPGLQMDLSYCGKGQKKFARALISLLVTFMQPQPFTHGPPASTV